MKNCDYILVTIELMGYCTFKPFYKQDLENWFITSEVKKEECIFLDDFEEFSSQYTKQNQKYIIIKGEIVQPKEEKIITKLTL